MEIEIISFGSISEFIDSQRMMLEGISDTDGLNSFLQERFPELQHIKYKLALNKELVQQNKKISDQATIAIMPPFSGG
ncbi:molybdopterin synthase sulfur carrier subunit [Pedobacter sp. UYP24]